MPDNELRDDFLAEAGELVQQLGEQLVELERSPGDPELLNAVFRAFHTVKGGAGFLALDPMVRMCHHAEDLLNEARGGRLALDAARMDALLQTLDLLEAMMRALAGGEPLPPPPDELLRRLAVPAAAPVAPAGIAAGERIDDDEFEALLDSLHGQGGTPGAPAAAPGPGPIDDSEFEALLDNLYGRGGAPGQPASPPQETAAGIDDGEFESLLDELHGKGMAPGVGHAAAPASPPAPAVAAERTPPPRSSAPAESSVRVDTARLDALVNRAGELVLVRNRLLSLAAHSGDESLAAAADELDRIADGLQGSVLGMRMQPVRRLFQRFPRIVRDLARQLGKQVELVLEGEDTELDRSLVEALADPLVHLLRNALDHGLETPDERARAGKPPAGRVRLAACPRGEQVVIVVADDGRGMDPQRLRRKALEKGLLEPAQAERLGEQECLELIFRPGFSTAGTVSDISGRGVGMDVVKTRVAELGGTLQVRSRAGHGSELELAVPLTLAIVRVLMVRVGCRRLALPLGNVEEVFGLAEGQQGMLDGRTVAAHRGRALPLGDLAGWAGAHGEPPRQVVVAHVGHLRVGCLVHEVIGREDVMVKPLGPLFEGVAGVAGATITGDGRLALVLDPATLLGEHGPLLPAMRATA